MKRLAILLALCLVVGWQAFSPAIAQEDKSTAPFAYRQLDDPAKEQAAQDLMETLRCLQCQGQSIADSDAPIAGSMRSLVRERIQSGEEPEAIRAWLIERYGDYVSYAPQLTSLTWPLYAVPAALMLLAFVLLRRRFASGRSVRDNGDDTE